nr:hypothetical protein [Tanacetum cinerariifolium]
EAKLLKKPVAQVAHRDKRISARENEIKNLETLLEAKTDMKKSAKNKSAELSKELENIRALFSDFQRCAKMDARLEALSIYFDEELYPHMLTAIAGRRWAIGRGLRLAVMKYGESTKLRQAFADVVSAGIAKGTSEGLKHGYPLVDQLESLKDAPMDVIMASLHLESDTGDDALQWIRELRPSSSQLTIPVYSEARDPMDPWACKEEILLADAIAANVSRAEKKKNAEWYAIRTGSAPRITPGPIVFRYPCKPLLLKVSLSCWRMLLHRLKYLRTRPLLGYLGRAPGLLCIVESSHSIACARSRRSSSKSRFSRSSSSLLTMSTAAVRYVGIPISDGYDRFSSIS